jgi:hypothetical protein
MEHIKYRIILYIIPVTLMALYITRAVSIRYELYIIPEMHKFSKNLGSTSKFYAPEERFEVNFILGQKKVQT